MGLIKDRGVCRRHRTPNTLVVRAEHAHPEWWCSRCRVRRSVTEGSFFEGSRLSIGKLLMLTFCFADQESYAKTMRACTFSATDEQLGSATIANWFSQGGIRHEDIGHHLVEYVWRRECTRNNVDPFRSIIEASCKFQ